MNRWWQYLNLAGVLALAALCVAQWQIDRRLNLEINRLETLRLGHEKTIKEHRQTIDGLSADLADFKERFKSTHEQLREAEQNVRDARNDISQLTTERDELKSRLDDWAEAVKQRDESIREANARIEELSARLTASIQEFNALATNYNSVVEALNQARAAAAPPN